MSATWGATKAAVSAQGLRLDAAARPGDPRASEGGAVP